MAALTAARFKSAVRAKEPVPSDTVLRKDYTSTVESLEDRRVRFTISTAAVDRDDDSIAVDGWDLAAYKMNPVVLWGHDGRALPIGKCVEIGSDGTSLKAVVEFLPADMPERGPFAEAVLRMCRTGFLSTTSVGFRPLEFEMASERITDEDVWFPPMNFLKQELMEFSIVSIPCNPEALIDPGERRGVLVVPPAETVDPAVARAASEAEEKIARAKKDRESRIRRARLVGFS